ncbi:MAG: hypothetical protein IKB13_06500 [Clostridia bacterium]|nr:hypothetical protein [Clostridia bacterium]
MLDKMLDAARNTGDFMLRYQYQKNMMLENLLSDREIDIIADRVIQRIRITADISEIIAAIDEIEKRINDLMK